MPTYVYSCASCKKKHEIIQKMSEEPIKKCPDCAQETMRRIIPENVTFQFKGAGFYITDYQNNSLATPESTPEKSCDTGKCGCC